MKGILIMCYKSPQPRCSGHTGSRLVSLDARIDSTKKAMKDVNAKIAKLVDSKEGSHADLQRKSKQIERLTRENSKNYENLVKATEERKVVQRDYDGTPKGQKELQAIIDDEKSSKNLIKECSKRLVQGKVMRSWRMNQKRRSDGETQSYKSTRAEKNDKIFLNDRKTIKAINARRAVAA